MRIGFDAKRIFHNASGLGNYSRDLIRILSEKYPENHYLLYNPKQGKINRITEEKNISIHYPETNFGKRFSSYWRRSAIVKQLKKDKLDLFHGLSNELPESIENTGIPSIVTIHDLIFLRYPEWYGKVETFIHTKKIKQAAHAANFVIAISEQTKNDLIEFLNIPGEKIKVIYQGCHQAFKKFYSGEEKIAVKNKFHLPEKFLLNVGTIEERKNLLTIAKSLKHHDLPLVVIGKETKYTEKVKQYLHENNLENRVQFLKNVSMQELAIIYQSSSVFLYPSVFEGFGIPIIEALYSKVPVITSKGSCFPEAGGNSSFYIDTFDEKMLAEKANLLMNNENLYQQTVENGYKYAQRFNDDVIAKQVMNLYQQTIKH
ncbi:glycosyl transferase family 1 [Arachidicoccus ginsenosidimutans]|nr:glycosyl transferase family 1 [Arachidicoccus sp. BS20]